MSAAYRRLFSSLLLAALAAGSFAPVAHAGHWFGENFVATGDDLNLAKPVPGNALLAGGRVSITSPVSGSLSLAGGEVEVEAPVSGSARLAAGQLTVRAPIEGKLWATAGELELDARVGGSAWLASGTIQTGADAVFAEDSRISAGESTLDGRFEGPVTLRGGQVRLLGHFLKDVEIHADHLELDPAARLDGHLRYYTPDEITATEIAQVHGGLDHTVERHHRGRFERPFPRVGGWATFVCVLLLGALLLKVAPEFIARTQTTLAREPWTCLGLGFLTLIGVPVAVIVLFLTIIGIPVGALVLLAFIGFLIAGSVIGATYIAAKLLARWRPGTAPTYGQQLAALAAVLAVLALLRYAPGIGALAHGLVLLFGLGAAVAVALRRDGAPAVSR